MQVEGPPCLAPNYHIGAAVACWTVCGVFYDAYDLQVQGYLFGFPRGFSVFRGLQGAAIEPGSRAPTSASARRQAQGISCIISRRFPGSTDAPRSTPSSFSSGGSLPEARFSVCAREVCCNVPVLAVLVGNGLLPSQCFLVLPLTSTATAWLKSTQRRLQPMQRLTGV